MRGLYGKRVAAITGDLAKEKLAPYLCNLITSETALPAAEVVFHSLRPYGGVAALPANSGFTEQVKSGNFHNARLTSHGDWSILTREGALPGSDDWTHQYANAAQTAVNKDGNVKAPFGVLWFGGPPHSGILPRHGHGPSPQVAGGRLFIEGADMLRAVDVYTGRLLWEKELLGFGEYYNTTAHFAGAGEIGSNYVSLRDEVYAVMGNKILVLDAAEGKTKRELKTDSFWGHLSVEGDYLVATSAPVEVKKSSPKSTVPPDQKTIISRHADWHYLSGKDPGDDWADLDFKPGKDWKVGRAGFGYGDGDDKTELKMKGKFPRVYIRNEFTGTEAKGGLSLSISYDDAFIAYLNGAEVIRKNVGSGRGASAKKVSSHEAGKFEVFRIDLKDRLRPGKNVIAIEGHNTGLTSSDFSLDPILLAKQESEATPRKEVSQVPATRFSSGSRRLVVFDRKSGRQLWEREAEFNFRHNNIALGKDRIFCIDKLTDERFAYLNRRGLQLEGTPTMYALDLQTGKVLWKHTENVFGTFLNYSAEHDLVLQAGSKYRDRAGDEIGRGMMVVRGKDGQIAWHKPDLEYGGPCLLWHDQILTNGAGGFSISLLDGSPTGISYRREYGCNTAIGSEHLITFRSGAAGFFDLEGWSGTGNLGGFRSSCTNNLIAANGVLNAPDYTRTCSCSYQNQTSLALIHMPKAEFWTFGGNAVPNRVGVNFGAPGDRRSDDGTLFCEYPGGAGKSEEADVRIEGKTRILRDHSSLMKSGGATPWLSASAMEGVTEVSIELPQEPGDKTCTVRLWFAEMEAGIRAGDRVFDISIEEKSVLQSFDPIAEAGQVRYGVVKEFPRLKIDGDSVKIELDPREGSKPPLLSAVEILIHD